MSRAVDGAVAVAHTTDRVAGRLEYEKTSSRDTDNQSERNGESQPGNNVDDNGVQRVCR